MKKICNRCEDSFPIEDYHKDKRYPDGCINTCKYCISKEMAIKYTLNRKKIIAKNKKWQLENPEKAKNSRKKFYQKHREECIIRNREWAQRNPDKLQRATKKYLSNHPEAGAITSKKYRDKNPEVVRQTLKKYRSKYYIDPHHRLKVLMRSRLLAAVKGFNKAASTIKLIGCTIEFLKQHLEKQFQDGMSWDNQGQWHIDHIKPCDSFDFSKQEDQYKCFHYTNLQPLWAKDNQKKKNKIIYEK